MTLSILSRCLLLAAFAVSQGAGAQAPLPIPYETFAASLSPGEAALADALLGNGSQASDSVGPVYAGVRWCVDSRSARPQRLPDGQIHRLAGCPLPVCCLTYDCERGAAGVGELIPELASADARATGFWLGTTVAGFPDLADAFRRMGNDVGLHSWTHKVQPRLDNAAFASEVRRAGDAVVTATRADADGLYRFPYGEGCARECSLLAQMGFRAFFWTLDTRDWDKKTAAQVEAGAGKAERGSIVLMHDSAGAVGACVPLVERLRRKGLEPVALSYALAPVYAQPCVLAPGAIVPVVGVPDDRRTALGSSEGVALESPDGRWVALLRGGRLCLWDRETCSGVAGADDAAAVCWSPEGEFLAAASDAPDAQIYVLHPASVCALACAEGVKHLERLNGALRVSSRGTRNGSPAFGDAPGCVAWRRGAADGGEELVGCGLRRLSAWAALTVSGAPGATVTVRIRGREPRKATSPCRLIVDVADTGATADVFVEGDDGVHGAFTVDLEMGRESEVRVTQG